MVYEYKLELLDEARLNDLGQEHWEAVGIASGDRVLLKRDADLPCVTNGLRDHPTGTVLTVLSLAPVAELRIDPRACYDALSTAAVGDRALTASFGARAERGNDDHGTFFEYHTTGRVLHARTDAFDRTPQTLPTTLLARWVIDQLLLVTRAFAQWGYAGQVESSLTVSGLRGRILQCGGSSHDSIPIVLPYVQVKDVSPLGQAMEENGSPLANRLFDQLHWQLGSPYDPCFDGEGHLLSG